VTTETLGGHLLMTSYSETLVVRFREAFDTLYFRYNSAMIHSKAVCGFCFGLATYGPYYRSLSILPFMGW